jgi:hypothetical protein
MGAPLVSLPSGPGSDWTFAVKQPINQGFDDCAFPARPGQLFNAPDPALAQVAMAGGFRNAENTFEPGSAMRNQVAGGKRRRNRTRKMRGGAVDSIEASHGYLANGWTQELKHGSSPATEWGVDTGLAQTVMAGGSRMRGGAIDPIEAEHGYPPDGWETPSTHGGQMPTYGPQTGLAQTAFAGGRRRRAQRTRRMRGGGCGCTGNKLFGGSRRSRRAQRTRRMQGGASYGYAIDPSVSIGGSGPNVDALRTPVPCDARAGTTPASSAAEGPADPRAYGTGYSLTPNTTPPTGQAGVPSVQAGGAYTTGNAYPDSCYKAPGSMLPVYNAQTAGFNFYPSTAHNGTLPDGVTPYNDVVPYAARMGGGRRRRRGRKGSRKGPRRH